MDLPIDPARRLTLGLGAAALVTTLLDGIGSASAADAPESSAFSSPLAPDGRSLKAIRVFTGADGHSHFEDIVLQAVERKEKFQTASGAVPEQGFLTFLSRKAQALTILSGPANLELPKHNAPSDKKEFFFMLQGSNMLITRTASRLITPGMIVIFEDATGTGHSGKVGPHGYTVINVQLAD